MNIACIRLNILYTDIILMLKSVHFFNINNFIEMSRNFRFLKTIIQNLLLLCGKVTENNYIHFFYNVNYIFFF